MAEIYYVYVARCSDGTLYTGYATDLVERERAHNEGRGARYTSNRRPVVFVYSEQFRAKGEALKREYVIKQLSRSEKELLIAGT